MTKRTATLHLLENSNTTPPVQCCSFTCCSTSEAKFVISTGRAATSLCLLRSPRGSFVVVIHFVVERSLVDRLKHTTTPIGALHAVLGLTVAVRAIEER